ncbi:MAG: branched-chain amino acid ABC transporter permease [Rhodospirillales bacterium]|nr:branched-chain amino acid ABC transporter permease [Rhodospirillales bacterium]
MIQLLNALQLSMLLFLLAIGLSVVFGLMNFINLAHGTLYMIGAYVGFAVAKATGTYWAAFLVAPLAAAILGLVLYQLLFKRMQHQSPMRQVLLTFGLIYVGLDAVRLIWGNYSQSVPVPDLLKGQVTILGEPYPLYRLFIIGLGLAVLVLLHIGLERTKLGAMVRAGVDDAETARSIGIDTDRVFILVFALGCGLAGLAGIVAAPVLSVYPGMDMAILILTLIVVVVGGPGSLKGAALGALLIGMVDTFGRVFLPELALVMIYAVMALVLLVRPQGLLPIK